MELGHRVPKRKGAPAPAESDGGDVLANIMATMTENDALKSKGREARLAMENRESSESAVLQIASFLNDVARLAATNPGKNVEVEFRFGITVQNAFRPGVAQEDWNMMRENFDNMPELTWTNIKETDYIYDKQDLVEYMKFDADQLAGLGENVRLTLDERTGKWSASAKHRVKSYNPSMPAVASYDLRVSVAYEQELALPSDTSSLPLPNYKTMRKKDRKSYRRKDEQGLWVTDLTCVESMKNDQYQGRGQPQEELQSETYEVELELTKSTIPKLSNESQLQTVIRTVWDALSKVNRLHPPQRDDTVADDLKALNLVKVKTRDELDALRYSVLKLIPSADTEHNEFPGSMPVAFSRRHFQRLQHAPYFVSEKTDGVRYLLYISNKPAVYLIDRKFDFYSLTNSFGELCNVLSEEGTTLLDGEMLKHKERDPPHLYFMVFDVIYLNGHSVALDLLSKRLTHVAEAVKMYRDGVEAQRIPKDHPFELIGKAFFPKAHIRHLLSKISTTTPHERTYKDARRCHNTDGIIFTPEEPYSARGTPTLFKWKYIDRISIDFKLVPQRDVMQLACRGNNNEAIVCRAADFPADDLRKINALMRDLELQRRRRGATEVAPPIVECAYDPSAGTWRLHAVRTDKAQPNHIRVVFDTMESIAENITIDEIVNVCEGRHPKEHRKPQAPQDAKKRDLTHSNSSNKEAIE